MYNIEISTHTDIGDKKKTNQDSIFANNGEINGHKVGMFIVADGCGGLAFGEEVSKLIVTYFSRVWNDELSNLLMQKKFRSMDIDTMLNNAIKAINVEAINFSRQVGSKVGSTLSLLLTIDNRYYVKNVGDSRVYLCRGKKITQITEDQSLVADMLRNGELTEEEARNFKRKNVLTMCVGVFEDIQVYSASGKIINGDVFVVCCDGIHNCVSSNRMLEVIKDKHIPFKDKAHEIRNSIESGKATDNVTSIICRLYSKKKRISKVLLIVLAVLLILMGIIIRNYIGEYVRNLIDPCIFPDEINELSIRVGVQNVD